MLTEALAACKPMKAEKPHPFVGGEMVKMQIHGIENGNCKFTQTMPGNGLETCLFNESHREQLRKEGEAAYDRLSMDDNLCKVSGY